MGIPLCDRCRKPVEDDDAGEWMCIDGTPFRMHAECVHDKADDVGIYHIQDHDTFVLQAQDG